MRACRDHAPRVPLWARARAEGALGRAAKRARAHALIPAGELYVGGADAALDDFDARLTHIWFGNRDRLDHHHSALLQPRREHARVQESATALFLHDVEP
jgi:hypothetical protein